MLSCADDTRQGSTLTTEWSDEGIPCREFNLASNAWRTAHSPGPVTAFATSEARTGIVCPFERSPTAMRRLDPDFVPHEVSFVVPGNTFFCSLPAIELLNKFPTSQRREE